MWPNSSCSICLVSALMWIGRVVVLQPESSSHAHIHATISPPILPCVHIAEDLWAPPLSTRADACALQAYTQLPAPSNHHLNSGISMSSSSINFWRLLCRQSKDTQHKVHRHQQNHLCTCHCHWHKPTKQTTSPLKFEPYMDRQCLIVCDPLTLVLDAPTYSY